MPKGTDFSISHFYTNPSIKIVKYEQYFFHHPKHTNLQVIKANQVSSKIKIIKKTKKNKEN